jgi:hypothetical protein
LKEAVYGKACFNGYAEMAGKAVTGAAGNYTHGHRAVQQPLRYFVHRTVAAYCYYLLKAGSTGSARQLGSMAAVLSKLDCTFHIVAFARFYNAAFELGLISCTGVFVDDEQYLPHSVIHSFHHRDFSFIRGIVWSLHGPAVAKLWRAR